MPFSIGAAIICSNMQWSPGLLTLKLSKPWLHSYNNPDLTATCSSSPLLALIIGSGCRLPWTPGLRPANQVPLRVRMSRLAQAAVVALADNIQALQKQLEQSELDCVNQKAQIAMLTRLTGPAEAAPVKPPANADAAATVEPGSSDAPTINGRTSTEVRCL